MRFNAIAKGLILSSALFGAMAQTASAADFPPPVQIEYGFTTDGRRDLIDDLAAHKVSWVRIGVTPVVVDYRSPTSIVFNEADWEQAADAYRYARSKGIKVYLNTHPAYELPKLNLSHADFVTAVRTQYQRLAAKFPDVEAWQIYNEANIAHKDNYKTVCEWPEFQCASPGNPTVLPPAYLSELYDTIAAARGAIKAVNPAALVTTNAAGANAYSRNFMNQLAPLLDIFPFDVYPGEGDYASGLTGFKNVLTTLKAEYGESLWIAETGQYAGSGGCSFDKANAHVQRDRLLSLITATAETGIKHVFLYRHKDFTVPWLPFDSCELHFGVVDRLGAKKASFRPVMEAIDLYAYMPRTGNTTTTSRAVATLHRAFKDSLGRAPTTWEMHVDGWLAATVAGRSYDQIVALNSAWLKTPEAAQVRRDTVAQSYRESFGRDADANELQNWSAADFGTYKGLLTAHVNWMNTSAGQPEKSATITRSIQTAFGYTPTAEEVAAWMGAPTISYEHLLEQHRNWADYHRP